MRFVECRLRWAFFNPRSAFRVPHWRQRQTDLETRAATCAATLGLHCPAVEFNQVANDCEAEAEAAVPARRAGIRLAKAVEDEGQKLRVNPFAGICN